MQRRKNKKGTSNYPENRKKKRVHVQWFNLERVTDKWMVSPEYFYMFQIKGEWWACTPEGNFYGNIEINGDYYRPAWPVAFYDGQNGDIVIGYVGVIYYSNMGVHKGRFVFVKNHLSAGEELSRALGYKQQVREEYYKKFEIWKTHHKKSFRPAQDTGSESTGQTPSIEHPDIRP